MTKKVYEYKVKGTGWFPVDMLRYDQAWPASSDDCPSITLNERDLSEFTAERQVLLHGIRVPTVDRWRSFGWQVLKTVIWKRGKMVESDYQEIG